MKLISLKIGGYWLHTKFAYEFSVPGLACFLVIIAVQGSRLFLNIRRANEKLTTSMVPQYLSTLRFASQNNMNNPGVNTTMHYGHHDSTASESD
jgi:hypothetical protein